LEEFLEYWHSLPREGGSFLPHRAALKPSSLHDVLPRLSLLKRLDRYNVMVSTMGTKSDSSWHGPMVGMNAFDLTAPAMRENTAELYSAVLDQPSAAILRETISRKDGKPVDVASLYLPLTDKNGAPTYIVGCTIFEKPTEAGGVGDRMLLDHSRLRDIEFIDIGGGKPIYHFKRPEPRGPEPAQNKWWDRFSFAKSRNSQQLDA
jgi:hypothetical protein